MAIVEAFEKSTAVAGEVIIEQGAPGDYFYVIESGEVNVVKSVNGVMSSVERTLGAGAFFGELALLYNTPRAAFVIAARDTVLWRIDRGTYRTIVTYMKSLLMKEHSDFIRNVTILERRLGDVLSPSDLVKVVTSLEVETFEPGAVIVRQHQKGDCFYIIAEGEVAVWKRESARPSPSRSNEHPLGKHIATLKKGQYFGEKALLADEVRQASCVALGVVVCLTLGRQDFTAMVGSWDDITTTAATQQTKKEKEEIVHRRRSVEGDKYSILSVSRLEEFVPLNVIGRGAFGIVSAAQHQSTGNLVALKCSSKQVNE